MRRVTKNLRKDKKIKRFLLKVCYFHSIIKGGNQGAGM